MHHNTDVFGLGSGSEDDREESKNEEPARAPFALTSRDKKPANDDKATGKKEKVVVKKDTKPSFTTDVSTQPKAIEPALKLPALF